jgi:hypothetical protein
MEWFGTHWTNIHEILYFSIFRKKSRKILVSFKSDKNNGYFTWKPIYNFLIMSRLFLLRMRNVSDTSCRENQNTHFVFNNPSPPENRAVYEIMWKNMVEQGRQPMTIWCMRIACWIHKATHTHSQYVILIVFPLQQWLQERASVLRHTYIACLVHCCCG